MLGILLLTSPASADVVERDACDEAAMLAPAEVGLRTTGFDAPRGPCPAPGLYWLNRGHARIETSDFYGTVGASSVFGARIEMPEAFFGRYEVELGARLIDYRFAQTAVVTASELSVGPVFFGAVFPHYRGDAWAFGSSGRVELQVTDSGDERQALSVAGAAHAMYAPGDALALHARVAAISDMNRVAAPVSLDLTASPARWFAWSIGVEAQTGWFRFDDGVLDHAAARTALRFRAGLHRIELAGGFAAFGADRPTAVAQLMWTRAL